MPDFGNPFNGNNLQRNEKLSLQEMTRALRFAIAAESEAVQLYEQLSDSSTNILFKKVLLSISEEEKVHIGELMKVLFELDSNEKKKYEEGFREVENMIKK